VVFAIAMKEGGQSVWFEVNTDSNWIPKNFR